MRLVEKAWNEYRDKVIPKGSPQVQFDECQKAFYSGALAVFAVAVTIGEPDVPEQKGFDILTAIDNEFKEYIKLHAQAAKQMSTE